MKLTWFGGTTIRIHIGGAILVVDADGAPAGIDAAELVSGADMIIERFGVQLTSVDPVQWRPRKQPRLLDEIGHDTTVDLWRVDPGGVLIDAIGEAPLLLVKEYEVPDLGHWAERAVVVLFGSDLKERTELMRDAVTPKLVALAGEDRDIDETFEALDGRDYGMGLIALHARLALEV